MKRDYLNRQMSTGKDKTVRFDRDHAGKTCGQCVHYHICKDKFKYSEGHRACKNFVELKP